MKTILTAKLKLHTTSETGQRLLDTAGAYRKALNYTSQVAFEHGKLSNQVKLHGLVYPALRARFALPSQLACSVSRQVGATYKALWTKVKHNAVHRQRGYTPKRYKGLDQAPVFTSNTTTFTYQRDYRFKSGQRVSLTTLDGPVIVAYDGYAKHRDLIQKGASGGVTFGAAKLWRDPRTHRFYLLVSVEVDTPDPTPESLKGIKGADLGERYLAVTTTPGNKTQFFRGGAIRHKGEAFQRVRSRLQSKGTRGAQKRLRQWQLRERRFKADVNHRIAKAIVEPGFLIGLEDLSRIRERTNVRGRQNRRRRAQWAFAELGAFIAYKAQVAGGLAIRVDADYTSKGCPRCGHVDETNRPNKGLRFCCTACGFTLHADLVGARNVTLRTLLIRQDWMGTGLLSTAPDGSDDETKAKRLHRFLELRWNPDPSSAL